MNFADERGVRAGFWAVLLLGVFAWAPATYPGYWQALDGFVPVFNVASSSSLAGVATNADVWNGTGSATFLLSQPLLLFGFSPVAAVRFHFAVSLMLGGLAIYAWLRPRFDDRTAGLAGITYLFLPIVLSTTYIRGSAGDAMIVTLLSLALAAAAAYASGESPAIAGLLVIAVIWMWRSQAGLALPATLLLLSYALLAERHRLTALVVGVAGAAGFVSLIPQFDFLAASPVVFDEHYLFLPQLFSTGWETASSIPGWQDRYPFQIGAAAVLLGIMSFWLWRRGRADGSAIGSSGAFLWFVFGASFVLVSLSLNVAQPIWRLTGAERLLTYPWQILLLAAPLLAAAAGSLAHMNESLRRAPLWAVLVAVVLLAGYPTLKADFTQVTPPDRPVSMFGSHNNIAVLDANLTEAVDGSATLAITWQALQPLTFDYNVFFQAVIEADGEAGNTVDVVAQLDTPPLDEARPATTWQPGQIFSTSYRLNLPPPMSDTAQHPFTYYFGFYDWRDGSRLPVNGGISDKMVFYGR